MSFGLRVKNPAGDVVIDHRSLGPVYIGRPSLVEAGGEGPAGPLSRRWRPYRYLIDALTDHHPPIVFCALKPGTPVQVQYVQRVLGTPRTWEIGVYSGSYGSYLAFNDSVAPEVFAFSPPGPTPVGNFGVALKHGGVLAWDLSRRPLWIRQLASMSGYADAGPGPFTESSFALIGGLAKPAILMTTGGYWSSTNYVTERMIWGSHGWSLEGGAVYRRPVLLYSDSGSGGGLPFPDYSLSPTFAVVIDAANLP